MQIQDLILNCPTCDSWYSRKTAPAKEFKNIKGGIGFVEVYFCNCNNRKTELKDAHEWDLVTPYNQIKVEILKDELYHAEERVKEIQQQIDKIEGN